MMAHIAFPPFRTSISNLPLFVTPNVNFRILPEPSVLFCSMNRVVAVLFSAVYLIYFASQFVRAPNDSLFRYRYKVPRAQLF